MNFSNCTYVHRAGSIDRIVRLRCKDKNVNCGNRHKKKNEKPKWNEKLEEPKTKQLTTMWYFKVHILLKQNKHIAPSCSHKCHSLLELSLNVIHFHHLIKHHPSSTSFLPVFHIRFYFPSSSGTFFGFSLFRCVCVCEPVSVCLCVRAIALVSHSLCERMSAVAVQFETRWWPVYFGWFGWRAFLSMFLFWYHFHLSFWHSRLSCVNGVHFFLCFMFAILSVAFWLSLFLSNSVGFAFK